MSNYFEIVFEDVNQRDLEKLLIYLFGSSERVSDINVPEDLDGRHKNCSHIELAKLVFEVGLSAIMVTLHGFSMDGKTKIPSALFRIIKYEDKVDVDFFFESSDHDWVDSVMLSAMKFCKNISTRLGVGKIYAGMEPASDENTRYFTNDRPGPLLSNLIRRM